MTQPGEHNGRRSGRFKFKLGCVLVVLLVLAAAVVALAFLNSFYGAMGRV